MSPEEEVKVTKSAVPETSTAAPLTIMSSQDAYISERMKSQPNSISEIEAAPQEEKTGIHRLSLPEFFEHLSYDCTRGNSCAEHGWVKREITYGLDLKMHRWEQTKRGKFIFRWLSKNKRALDQSMNVKDWFLVNRDFADFEKAPRILFSINGGVENGDSILGFMPVAKALYLRNKPSKDSQNRVQSEETKHESHPNFYKAKLDSEQANGDDFASADARQEGRDF